MAGKLEPLEVEPPGVVEEAEAGQTKSSKKSDDLLAMVKKLQKEGSLEPQIEDLINRINELQQAKKKSSEELGEAQGLWETLHRELDSLNGEKVHLEEVLSKKQEALRILQLHCQMKDSEAQRLHVKEQLDLMGQHKDLWEFQILKQRLTWEIHSLQRSKEQLLTEENLARAKLQQVERRLRLPPVVEGAPAVNDALKAELEKFGGHGPAQTQSAPGDPTDEGEVGSPGRKRGGQGGRQSGQCLMNLAASSLADRKELQELHNRNIFIGRREQELRSYVRRWLLAESSVVIISQWISGLIYAFVSFLCDHPHPKVVHIVSHCRELYRYPREFLDVSGRGEENAVSAEPGNSSALLCQTPQ
ncbi:synaptonemal complex central element protein 1-like [Pteropus vampyrus]|uniref:Synaptonemal complex central element protein 1-like n=1 Tax=Pteropus vampyrus TaxID=132908 RepID=A0A6P3PWB7_PTEVA|nr:synaptonemal complex central element protein 1-like [Pteropus vampyrus]